MNPREIKKYMFTEEKRAEYDCHNPADSKANNHACYIQVTG